MKRPLPLSILTNRVPGRKKDLRGVRTDKPKEVLMKKTAVVIGCTGCDSCRWACPAEAISFDHAGAHVDPEKCIGCGTCVDECASEAIHIKDRTEGDGNEERCIEKR